jgi:hypothetical protein
MGPLAGTKIIDMTSVMMGPYCDPDRWVTTALM